MEIFEREEEDSESKNWDLLVAPNAVQTKTFSVWTNTRSYLPYERVVGLDVALPLYYYS